MAVKLKDFEFKYNSTNTSTARIQEMHILIGHIVCSCVEKSIFELNYERIFNS